MRALSYENAFLVDRLRGTLPVLLACGHDGTEQPEGVPPRSGKDLPANCLFNTSRDRDPPASPVPWPSNFGREQVRCPT